MDEALTDLAESMQPNEEHLKRQIHYILEQFNTGEEEQEDSSDEEEDEDEEDDDYDGEDGEEELEEEGDYDDTIYGAKVGEDWLTSQFLAPTNDAMRQTTTIREKMEEEKKERGLDSTSRSNIKRSLSRPITPSKTNSKIPFIDEQYMKSPMRTRNNIPRTPFDEQENDSRNDFKNDDKSDLDHSIILGKDRPPEFGGKVNKPKEKEEKEETKVERRKPAEENVDNTPIPHEAFGKKDKIPRTPPHFNPKQYVAEPEKEANKEHKPKLEKAKKSKK